MARSLLAFPAATIAIVLLATSSMVACGKSYLVVTASIERARASNPEQDVRQTDAYIAQKPSIQTVAFRFPDYCSDERAAVAGGVGASDAVLGNRCGVWLAELERATAREGYRIVSTDALVRLERQEGLSTYTAAKRLGAQLVFVLNNLGVAYDDAGQQSGLTLSYFHSNPDGEVLQAAELHDEERKFLREFVGRKAALSLAPGSPTAVKAVLDATAINADTGESIWFYRMALHKPLIAISDLKILFRGRGSNWRPVRRTNEIEPTDGLNARSHEDVIGYGSPTARQGAASAESALNQEAFQLVRTIANDFSTNFRAGGR